MFDPTREVPRLDLCQQLKKLGFPQETGGFYWRKFEDGWKIDYIPYISVVRRMVRQGVIIKAPTIIEMIEYFPDFIQPKSSGMKNFFYIRKNDLKELYKINIKHFTVNYGLNPMEVDETLPNAVVRMFIWLVKNKYIYFNKGGK